MNDFPVIDPQKCTLCGKCVDICPKEIIKKEKKSLTFSDEECMLCSHCYSVCKFNAIGFNDILRPLTFKSIKYKENNSIIMKSADLINFVRSRRSMRKYAKKQIKDNVLEDLVEFAVSAPSASNCQSWEFIIINGRNRVVDLALKFGDFYTKLNKMAANPFTRYISVLFAGKKLINYYRERYESVQRKLEESKNGSDPLFWGAPAVIIIHSSMDGSMPIEDAQYAAYNITLLAHSMGLGTCFIGYASESLNISKGLKRHLKIPDNNRVHAVLTVGHPDVKFHKLALRKEYEELTIS